MFGLGLVLILLMGALAIGIWSLVKWLR